MVLVTEIHRTRRGATLEFSDGVSFFCPRVILDNSSCSPGTEFEEEERSAFQRTCERYVIRAKALELLARREHSRYELRVKLLTRYPDASFLDEILWELVQNDLLDDRRFADARIRSRIGRPGMSLDKIRAELLSRGVERGIVDESLREFCEESGVTDGDLIHRAMDRFWPRVINDQEIRRLSRRMRSRGFRGIDIDRELRRRLEILDPKSEEI